MVALVCAIFWDEKHLKYTLLALVHSIPIIQISTDSLWLYGLTNNLMSPCFLERFCTTANSTVYSQLPSRLDTN